MRNSKNTKKVHKVALHSVTQILTKCNAQGSMLSALVVCLKCSAIVVVYWHLPDVYSTRMNNPLNRFMTAQEVDFLVICSLFSFLYLSISITGEVANKKFGKFTDYCYIRPLYHIQILAQYGHYSLRNGFPDYWLIILISISFQFYY